MGFDRFRINNAQGSKLKHSRSMYCVVSSPPYCYKAATMKHCNTCLYSLRRVSHRTFSSRLVPKSRLLLLFTRCSLFSTWQACAGAPPVVARAGGIISAVCERRLSSTHHHLHSLTYKQPTRRGEPSSSSRTAIFPPPASPSLCVLLSTACPTFLVTGQGCPVSARLLPCP